MADIKVRVGQQNAIKVASSLVGTPRPRTFRLSDLDDVNADPDSLLNGMVLVYNQATDKWDATLELTPGNTQNLDINGGSF
jgi:hypothetical protein